MSKFLSPPNKIVYHCMPVKAIGDKILPSDNYGAKISDVVAKKLRLETIPNAPLIFATPSKMKALGFALQSILQEKILNRSFGLSEGELVITCDREKMLSRCRDITIYAISSENFMMLDNAEKQCVSSKSIPFKETQVVFKASSVSEIIEQGLQIFSFKESFIELAEQGVIKKLHEASGENFYNLLGEMVRKGIVVWENKEKNNASLELSKKINSKIRIPVKNTFS